MNAPEWLLAREIELVPIDAIHPDPVNPNQGDIGAIGESVDRVGFYQVVFVQSSTGRIIAGEHRWRTLCERGSPVVPVVWLDVDDETARVIMVGDNEIPARTSQRDAHALAALLTDLAQQTEAGLKGTGLDSDDLDALIASVAGTEPIGTGSTEPAVDQLLTLLTDAQDWLAVGDEVRATTALDLAVAMRREELKR